MRAPARLLLLALAALPAALAVHKKFAKTVLPPFSDSCDGNIPGTWTGFNPRPLGDTYAMAWTQPPSPGAWTVTMVSGGGWGIGKGQLSPDNTTTTVVFDSGVSLTGNVSGKCGVIDWDNDSSWAVKPPPPPPVTDVVRAPDGARALPAPLPSSRTPTLAPPPRRARRASLP